MTDEQVSNHTNTETPEQVAPVANDIASKLQAFMFGDEVQPETGTENGTAVAPVAAAAAAPKLPEEEIIEPKDWLKRELDIDDINVLKQEREELKKLRETPKTFEFKNEDSKNIAELINEGKIDELYDKLHTRKQIEKLSTADLVANKNMAAELVKFGIKNDNKDAKLSDDEVDFLFSQQYAIPNKPTQFETETDDDYAIRVGTWEQQVSNIEKRIVIEAKMQQPKLAQLKTELVLPNIKKENQTAQAQPTQEDLAAFAKQKDDFLQTAQKSINGFNGFNVQVKDKDVDYTVGYNPSQEEKTLVDNKLKQFAEAGFNANALLAERWVAEDGKTLKVEQMVKDLSKIYADDKMLQKLVTDSANKRLEAHLKAKKQVDLSGTRQQGTFNPNNPKTESEKLAESFLAV